MFKDDSSMERGESESHSPKNLKNKQNQIENKNEGETLQYYEFDNSADI